MSFFRLLLKDVFTSVIYLIKGNKLEGLEYFLEICKGTKILKLCICY